MQQVVEDLVWIREQYLKCTEDAHLSNGEQQMAESRIRNSPKV